VSQRRKSVLILGNAHDFHANLVRQTVGSMSSEFDCHFLDTSEFPSRLKIQWNYPADASFLRLPDGAKVYFSDIHSIYWRNYNSIAVDRSVFFDARQLHIAENDARSFMEGWLQALPCKWVNGWQGFALHQVKPAALARVQALGLPVPETLLTNDPDGVLDFFSKHRAAIFKPVQGGAHTLRLTEEFLTPENLANLRLAPLTLQQEIKGTNIRVFIIGEQHFACEIASSQIDFRDDETPIIKKIELPDEVIAQSHAAAQALHLVWAGIDYRRDANGTYYFLEANPSPMFYGFEQASGLPITEALCHYLMT
jgi:hypothetical protein